MAAPFVLAEPGLVLARRDQAGPAVLDRRDP
jgi:hypothetical protein